ARDRARPGGRPGGRAHADVTRARPIGPPIVVHHTRDETMTQEQRNLATVHAFFDALNRGAGGEAIAAFYSDDAIQAEFPNAFLPRGARRTVADIGEAAARGSKLMAAQEFEILNA